MLVAHMLACATRKQVPRGRPACNGSDRLIQAAAPILATMDIGIRVLERISFRRDRREAVSSFANLLKECPTMISTHPRGASLKKPSLAVSRSATPAALADPNRSS